MESLHPNYTLIMSRNVSEAIEAYAKALRAGAECGGKLAEAVWRGDAGGADLKSLDGASLLSALLNSKSPQIFAESAVKGDGSDWTLQELGILGDISIGMTVTIYDNGAHQNPIIHETPFTGHLIYTPGALLRNDMGHVPADWEAVTSGDAFDKDKYYRLYERRLLPAFRYISDSAIKRGRPAFVTLPGMGCGQFAGPFKGQMGHLFRAALMRLLDTHGEKFAGIKAVYFDPYNECIDEDHRIHGIRFMIRPLMPYNPGKSQLCRPETLADVQQGDAAYEDMRACELYSFVAWDHVSWPGNDYYLGARATDDGVKAAATNTMQRMTGLEGRYCPQRKIYLPPHGYNNWNDVVVQNGLKLLVKDNLFVV